ncbi:MAG: serine hydrolase [Bacteroidetes bacterium B1(2017)]|nr:MAG: serine hydrolase [Bacteroidetes bacterium B1(2017)]
MRKILIGLSILLLGFVLFIQLSGNQHVYRTLAMTIFRGKLGPGIDELKDFPTRTIQNLKPEPWPKSTIYGSVQPAKELLEKATTYKTTAILVIQNDSILYETYFDGYDAKTVSNSFSMAKSFTGLLIGCALKDGYIKSLDEAIGMYVPEFTKSPYDKITIRHLLMMSSGLDFKESYGSLFGWPAKAYYGTDVNATVMNAPKLNEPGTVYEYKGGDTQLLGMILKKATGKNVAEYASERLWKQIGAEDQAYWSLDKENGMEKVSCCYYATAHDFARFGKLCMNYGKWNSTQLIDSSYIAQSMVLAPLKTKDGLPNTQYGYQWWVMNHEGLDVFYARGIKGQYIFCIPEKKLIIVRLGHKRADKKGEELPEDIFDYLNLGLGMCKN